LWMHVFNRARYAWAGPAAPGPVLRGGNRLLTRSEAQGEDLFGLLLAEGIYLGADLERLLRQRRAGGRDAWRKGRPRRGAGGGGGGEGGARGGGGGGAGGLVRPASRRDLRRPRPW